MVVGIYYGVTKPKSVKDFLKPFIDELKSVINNGILVNGHQVCVRVRCFICDSPARAFLKGDSIFNSLNVAYSFKINFRCCIF